MNVITTAIRQIPEQIAGHDVIGVLPTTTPDRLVLIGLDSREQDLPAYATWEWSPDGGAYWGHYDYRALAEAISDAVQRVGLPPLSAITER